MPLKSPPTGGARSQSPQQQQQDTKVRPGSTQGSKPGSPGALKRAEAKQAAKAEAALKRAAAQLFGVARGGLKATAIKEDPKKREIQERIARRMDAEAVSELLEEIDRMKEQIEELEKTSKMCFVCKKNSLKSRNPFRKIQSKIDVRANELLKSIDFTEVIRKAFPESNLNNLNSLLLPRPGRPKSSQSAIGYSLNDSNSTNGDNVANNCGDSSGGGGGKGFLNNSDKNNDTDVGATINSTTGLSSRPKTPASGLSTARKKGEVEVTSQELHLIRALNLPNADGIFGSADPYVVVKWTTDRQNWTEFGRSDVIKNCLNPVWNNIHYQITPRVKTQLSFACALSIEVWDWDLIGSSNFLGGYEASYEELNDWFKESDKSMGNIVHKELKLGKLSTLEKSVNQSLTDNSNAVIEIGIQASVFDDEAAAVEEEKVDTGTSTLSSNLLSFISRSSTPAPTGSDLNRNKKGAEAAKSSNLLVRDALIDPDELTKQKFEIHVLSCSKLAKADILFGKSDPYVIVKWNDVEIGKTPHIVKTLNPVWTDQQFKLMLPYFEDVGDNSLIFEVWDYDLVGDHDFLGGFEVTGKELCSWIDEARLGQSETHDSISIRRNLSLDKVDYLSYSDQNLAQGVIEIGIKRVGVYRDPFFEVDEETDAADYDESLVLTRHIVDSIYALKHILALKRVEKEKQMEMHPLAVGDIVKRNPEYKGTAGGVLSDDGSTGVIESIESDGDFKVHVAEKQDFDLYTSEQIVVVGRKVVNDAFSASLPDIFYRGVVSELVKVVISTITKPWGSEAVGDNSSRDTEALSENNVTVTKKVVDDFFNTSGYILELFPEIFNKSQRPMELNLLHLAVKYSPPHTVARVVKMLFKFDPRMACYVDDQFQTPLHFALQNKKTLLETVKLLLEANPAALETKDSKGMLPLHIACMIDGNSYLDVEIINYIIERYPMAVMLTCNKGRLPLHIVANNDPPNVKIMSLLISKHPGSIVSECKAGWLPIHRLVCRSNVPFDALKLLLGSPPPSPGVATSSAAAAEIPSKFRNNNGQLPIHIYCDMPRRDPLIALTLIDSYPDGLLIADKNKYLPIHTICDNSSPDYDILLLMIRGTVGISSLSTGVPGTVLPSGSRPQLLPLHFLVGMAEKLNYGICALVAAMFPQAIHSGEFRNTKNEGFSWSPYSKARERCAFRLVAEFDKILVDDNYRQSLVKSYQDSIVTIVNEIYNIKNNSSSYNNSSDGKSGIGNEQDAGALSTSNKSNTSSNGAPAAAGDDDSSSCGSKSGIEVGTVIKSSQSAAAIIGVKVEKSIYARSAVKKFYRTLYAKEEDGEDNVYVADGLLRGAKYDTSTVDDVGVVTSKVYSYKKPVTLKSITGASRALGAFSPIGKSSTSKQKTQELHDVDYEDGGGGENKDSETVDIDDTTAAADAAGDGSDGGRTTGIKRGGVLNPSPLTDPLAVRRFVDGAFEASKKKDVKRISVNKKDASPSSLSENSPSSPKINQKDVSATMKRLKEMGLLPTSQMAEKAAKSKSLIEIHKYLCDFEDTDEYVPKPNKSKNKNNNKWDITDKLPEVRQMQSFVEGSVARATVERQAEYKKNLIKTHSYVFTPSVVDQIKDL